LAERGALALDLDGTLVDPRPRQLAVLADLVGAEPGLDPLDEDRLWELKRDGLTTHEALVRLGVGVATAARLGERWVATVEERRWLGLDRLLPGVPEALESLNRAGCRPLILTARRHRDRVIEQVASLGLGASCAAVVVVPPATAAEAKAAELEAHGCEGFVGDTESDARAAELAGVPFAAVATGQRSRRFLRERRLAAFDSLAEALGALPAIAGPAR
jgi:phosphoglycolate phosphatase-like HAD superfamily hydrolase